MKDMLKNELADIKTSYELLIDGIEILEAKIRENYIPYYSVKDDLDKVGDALQKSKEIKRHLEGLNKMKHEWKGIIGEESSEEEIDEQEDVEDAKEVIERTTWTIENSCVRIETIRKDGNSSYPNIIPKHIFIETTMAIMDQFRKYNKDYIKKSSIEMLMKDRIIAETNYKKSPGTVVYSIIKVLLKEGIIRRNANNRSIYVLDKDENYTNNWIESNIA